MKSSITIPKNFYKLLPLYKEATKKSVEEVTADLLRVAQQRAPVKSMTLEQSGDKKLKISKTRCTGIVSFKASRGGFNYAQKMDTASYHLGAKSLVKSSRGVRSKFSNTSMKVGSGYLSDSAVRCKEGYIHHVEEQLGTVPAQLGLK